MELNPCNCASTHTGCACAHSIKFYVDTQFSVNPPSPPTNLTATPDVTTINLTWAQLPADVVDSYLITYTFVEIYCGFTGRNVIRPVAGSFTGHTLHGLEENSEFSISIIARNAAGDSEAAEIMTTTSISGIFKLLYY